MASSNTTSTAEAFLTEAGLICVYLVISLVLAQSLCVFGIFANVINILLFRKMGYKEGVNVTLTALAISDIGNLAYKWGLTILNNPILFTGDHKIFDVFVLTFVGYPSNTFIRVSTMITAFAALERCLCVMFPLKVKSMITPKVALVVNIFIFLFHSLYLFPRYYVIYVDWTHPPGRNDSVLAVLYKSNKDSVIPIASFFTDMILPYSTFAVLVFSSTVILVKLKSMSKWRQSVSSSKNRKSSLSNKDKKSAKLFMTVSFMCILLLLPDSLLFTIAGAMGLPTPNGGYGEKVKLAANLLLVLHIINSSCTVFIYYKMSSKYRSEFKKMLAGCWK
ncbi:FMRFamide receptor [Biomphalaria pfeifferi]|uniref:FMRFamide receptor n=1 Tax=Biomphalaria pfeifferi TaxID=112525 RepID=A0AAD8EXV9_BIOPF|nr:FMRFamide receptor [Biomphalaria pfeifferi]